jgi:hypothetical protein
MVDTTTITTPAMNAADSILSKGRLNLDMFCCLCSSYY